MEHDLELIAKSAHEAIRQFNESNGDFSVKPWDESPENIKNSAIDGVKYLMKNPHATGKDMHDNWVKFKRADGWVYGKTKDAEKKTHPSIRPYEELDARERMKDDIFVSMVKAHISAK